MSRSSSDRTSDSSSDRTSDSSRDNRGSEGGSGSGRSSVSGGSSRRRRLASAALDRRTLLAAAGAAGVATGVGALNGPGRGSRATAHPMTHHAAVGDHRLPVGAPEGAPSPAGTTLGNVAVPRGSGSGSSSASASGYRRLGDGPGWERVVRTELAEPGGARAENRTALAAFVQFTDLHLTDVQHPLRHEYVRDNTGSTWRPQEALTVPGAVSLIEQVNALRGGPATGARIGFVMTTGDNTDNNCRAELDWFLTAMSGGRITPNTGDPRHYEGVQNSGLMLYWHPEDDLRDNDKQLGFPRIDGFLGAAIGQVNSPGLAVPWYATVGNHDVLPGGCYASGDGFLTEFAVGGRKLFELPEDEAVAMWKGIKEGLDPKGEALKELLRTHWRDMRGITPDPGRAPFTPSEYVEAHFEPRYEGHGPVGHGYTEANRAEGTAYYSFPIVDGVTGISLDTTDPGGHYTGSVGDGQLRWLEEELARHQENHVLIFSHHTSRTMHNTNSDPAHSGEQRHGGEELLDLLGRHRQVVAWINGHSHRNEITPHGTFWEISTASHIDFPQLARVIELVDNHDGTLSLFTTLIESAAPHRTDFGDLSQTGLAALYRELSFNRPGARTTLAGDPTDRNTELLLKKR